MEERIEHNERMIKASSEIEEEVTGDRLTHDFKQLERGSGSASADMQLLALKQKMGLLPSAPPASKKQLGAGGASRQREDEETVHAEIEDADDDDK